MAEYVLSAEIIPVLSRSFTASTKSQISKALAGVDAQVKVTGKFDGAGARTDIRKFVTANRVDIKLKGVFDDDGLAAKVKAAAEKASTDVKLGVDLDKRLVEAQLRELQRNRTATVKVESDFNANALAEKVKAATARSKSSVKVDADIAAAQAKLELLAKRREVATIKYNADVAEAQATIQALIRKRDEKDVDVDADLSKAQTKLDLLTKRHEIVTANLDLNTGAAEARLQQLLRRRDTNIHVGADTSSAQASISRLQALVAGVFVAIGVGGSALPSLLGAVTGGLGAVGGSAVGVAKALSAYSQEQNKAAKATGSSASEMLSQAIAIRNAQQNVDDARRNAARVAEQSARSISDAQANVASAERDYQEALRDSALAYQRIHAARQQAIRDLQDLQERVDDYALSEEEASIALARAQQNLDEVNNSGTASALDRRDAELALLQAKERLTEVNNKASSSDLDREVAALNVAQAQQRLNDVIKEAANADLDRREAALEVAQAQERLSDLAKQQTRDVEDLNAAQTAGVDGSEQVVSAREAERSANLRVQSAQEALQKAQTDLARTQQDAARAQEDAAIQVARALQGVSDAQQRAGAAAAASSTEVDKFAEAMAKLSPAGQQFVNQLLSMKGAWERFQKATQTATLPGWTDFLSSLASIEGPATKGIAAIGREISNIGYNAADLMRNPVFQGHLADAFENARPIVKAFGDGILTTTDRMVTFAADNENISRATASLITDLFGSVNAYYDGLETNTAGVARFLEGLGTIIEDVSGGVGTLFAQFSGAYAQNASTFEQTFSDLLDTFLDLTGAGLPALSNGLSILADALRTVNAVVQPFASFLGGMGGNILAGMAAFKLLSGAVNGVSAAFSAINPSNVAAKLENSKLGKAVSNVGSAAADGEAKTGKFSNALGKAGTAALGAAKYIPLVGIAAAGIGSLIQSSIEKSEKLTQALLSGGEAARNAEAAFKVLSVFDEDVAAKFQGRVNSLVSSMSPLERAQLDVTRAQNELTDATNNFGPTSDQAASASYRYSEAQGRLRDMQWRAEQATKTHTDKIREQQQAMLDQANGVVSYNSAMLQVKTAQQNVDAAIKQYGANSLEAKQAQNQLEQAMLGSVTAASQLATAQANGLPPSQQAVYVSDAYNRQLAILSQQAGTALPPALQEMVNKLSDSDLAALGAKVRMDELGNRVVTMPGGKEIIFPTNASDVKRQVDEIATSIQALFDKYDGRAINMDVNMNVHEQRDLGIIQSPGWGGGGRKDGGLVAFANGGLQAYPNGGAVRGPGGPRTDSILAAISNGEFVVNAKATARFLPLLQLINSNRFANGGLVGFADGGTATTTPAAAAAAAAAAGGEGVTFNIPDLAEPTEQIKALTEAAIALAGAVNSTLVPALLAQVTMQDTQLIPSLALLETHLQVFMPTANNTLLASTWALHGGVTAAWLAMQNGVWGSTNAQIGAFNTLNTGLAGVRDAMSFTADWAQTQYGRVWAAAADPIRAVLNGPINAGLIGAWNSLNAQFALNRPVAPVGVPFATGGFVSGPGGPTTDSIQARLSDGEYVIRAAVTKKVLPFLDALNAGQGEAMQAAGYLPGYATGGLVANTGSQLNAITARGLAWLNQQAGKPYIWGGVGPVGFDCSGLMSALTNVLRGEANPYRRLGVAASQPWPGFVPGLSSAFATGFNSHHTAGTLAGINAEARQSGVPVLVGSRASGADSAQFTGTASLPFVGGQFVSGGGDFDPAAIVSSAFQEALGMADSIAGQWPGNIAAQAGQGMTHRLVDAIIPAGSNILSSVLATTMGAGSPEVVAAVRAVATRYGWGEGPQWDALYKLIDGESGWDPEAKNPFTSAEGLGQKMTSLHGPLEPTVAGQAEWILSYIKNNPQYGDPITAYSKWMSRSPHWYDQGGFLPQRPGFYSIAKGTTKPEAVLSPSETAAYQAHADAIDRGQPIELGMITINRLADRLAAANATRPINLNNQETGISVAGV